MAYITVAELKAYARNETGGVDDLLLTTIVDAATQGINDFCQRTFAVAGSAAARVYVPSGTTILRVHDCTTITGITEDGTTLATTYWQAEPLNLLDDSGQTVPYQQVRRIDGGVWAQQSGYPGKASISVTATYGWAAVPAAVKAACYQLAARMAQRRDVRVDYAEELIVSDDAQGREIRRVLRPYRRVEAIGIA